MNENNQPEITVAQAFEVLTQVLAHPTLKLNLAEHNAAQVSLAKVRTLAPTAEPNLTIAAPANTTS